MTELLYLPDADDVATFTATVTEATRVHVILEETYFHPEGGGQPADRGVLERDDGRATVEDVWKDHGEVEHVLESIEGEPPEPGTTVEGRIDERRRRELSRMHTAQHVVSRVVLEEYGSTTAGDRIRVDRSRIDFEPADFDEADLERIQRLSNDAIERDYAVTKENRPRDVDIEGFDTCPCGGTHVDRLGEIGRVESTDRPSKGENVERLEFELRDS